MFFVALPGTVISELLKKRLAPSDGRVSASLDLFRRIYIDWWNPPSDATIGFKPYIGGR